MQPTSEGAAAPWNIQRLTFIFNLWPLLIVSWTLYLGLCISKRLDWQLQSSWNQTFTTYKKNNISMFEFSYNWKEYFSIIIWIQKFACFSLFGIGFLFLLTIVCWIFDPFPVKALLFLSKFIHTLFVVITTSDWLCCR